MVTLPTSYFDQMYATADDPWGFASRWYEQRKYALTLASLPDQQYFSGFEPACSIGVLTGLLAARCGRLLSCDASELAVAQARQRLADLPHVAVEQRELPAQWPAGSYDLVVLSELLYYFDDSDLETVISLATQAISPGGTLLAVHWRHVVADYPQTGEFVHEALRTKSAGLTHLAHHVEDDFLLDVYVNPLQGETSVAGREGLV